MIPCTFGKADDVRVVDGTSLDSEWDESSRCECLICGWDGTRKDTGARPAASRRAAFAAAAPGSRPAAPKSASPAARGGLDLEQIRHRLDTAPCPVTWKPHIESLVSEVERLRGLIDVMARVAKATRRSGRAASDDDTVVG
jgi:hypothetical protein